MKRRCVVRHQPAVVRRIEPVVRKPNVELAADKEQSGPLVFGDVVERDPSVDRVHPGTGDVRVDDDRAAGLLGAGRKVQRVKPVNVPGRSAADLLRRRDEVDVLVDGSITGVPVIPISFGMSSFSPVSAGGMVRHAGARVDEETRQSGVPERPSASNA